MKQYQVKCDVCGREIDDLELFHRIIFSKMTTYDAHKFLYACPTCFKKVYKCVMEIAKESSNKQ